MKIAVVGGSGFIGSHVVDKLLEQGHDVTVYDMMAPHRDVRHVFIDIMDFHRTVVALAGGYDAIYVLAAMADVNDVERSPLETAIVNFQGIVNILEAVRRYGGRIIFASTVWVYGLAADERVAEETPLLVQNVAHTYTASKIAAELYIKSYHSLYALDFSILRYGIPYGPRGRGGTVIASFVDRALRREPLVVHGDGSQYRNFIFVEDLAEGSLAALQEEARNEIFNLEGMRPVTVAEVAETVRAVVGDVEIQYVGARVGDYRGKLVSNEKALRQLGWQPRVDLEEGIGRYVAWWREIAAREREVPRIRA
jgi:UDP-glucose 4-epimerase